MKTSELCYLKLHNEELLSAIKSWKCDLGTILSLFPAVFRQCCYTYQKKNKEITELWLRTVAIQPKYTIRQFDYFLKTGSNSLAQLIFRNYDVWAVINSLCIKVNLISNSLLLESFTYHLSTLARPSHPRGFPCNKITISLLTNEQQVD